MDDKLINKALEDNSSKAQELLKDTDKLESFLQNLEKKLKVIPVAGNSLSNVPVLISCVRSYIKKEYTKMPLGSLIAIVASLIYIFTPIDIIPDILPGVGYLDDAAVITACLKLVSSDLDDYKNWRKEKNK